MSDLLGGKPIYFFTRTGADDMVRKKEVPGKESTLKSSPEKRATSVKKVSLKEPLPLQKKDPQGKSKFPIVGIGSSAGGLEAVEAFFQKMPPDSGMAFVLVAHLDPTHVSVLPELIKKRTPMDVVQVEDGTRVQPNTVYVIPPGKDLSILHGVLHLMEPVSPRRIHLPIDIFLRALAQDQGARAVCIILSGTGSDGTLGLKAIKGGTGMVMVQDEVSAKYDGMPHSAIATGLVDFILSPEDMPEQLIKYTKLLIQQPRQKDRVGKGKKTDVLKKILLLMQARTGHDFSLYKRDTINRRIERRMRVQQIEEVEEYLRYLQEGEREVDMLFKDLLIGVTRFFRDPEAFEALKTLVLPDLVEHKQDDISLRVWVPGCSSGEEAYSLAIILHEYLLQANRSLNIQIFATDINEESIIRARSGLYPESISADVDQKRLRNYFDKEESGYRIKNIIREMLVFAPQDVIQDPPFTKLDLICCRNLLIYFSQELQKRVLSVFHYSLKPSGILFLGSSETIGPESDFFISLDRKWKIFRRTPSAGTASLGLGFPHSPPVRAKVDEEVVGMIKKTEERSMLQVVEIILRQSDIPPCVIIDEADNTLYIHGHTGRFLEPSIGEVSVNILDMARPGLKEELASAIRNVSVTRQECVRRNLQVEFNGGSVGVDLVVRPLLEEITPCDLKMVIFQESGTEAQKGQEAGQHSVQRKSRDIEALEQELLHTKETLQNYIDELQTSNEELRSTNEELQSTNEELQSSNEELETSKEELQTLNEESLVTNVELQNRIDELSAMNDDMKNLLDSTKIATLFLDTDLNIRRFTPALTDIIPLTTVDIGRPLTHFSHNLNKFDLSSSAQEVLADLSVKEVEAANNSGHLYRIRIQPYRTVNNEVDGVVITFDDITRLKIIDGESRQAKEIAEAIVATIREPFLVLDDCLGVIAANQSFNIMFKLSEEQVVGKKLYELDKGQLDIPDLRRMLEKILSGNHTLEGYHIDYDFPERGRRKVLLNGRRLNTVNRPGRDMIFLGLEMAADQV